MSWQRWLIAVTVVVALCIAAFSAGRFSAPEVVSLKSVNQIQFVEKVVEKVVTVTAKAEARVIYRDVVREPDGRVVDRSIVKVDTKEDAKTQAVRVEAREVEKRVEVTKTVMLRPDWRVSAGVGASLNAPLVPIIGPLVIQAQVDRRIVGGVSVGLWASTVGAAGAAISLEF